MPVQNLLRYISFKICIFTIDNRVCCWAHTQFGPETALARHSLRPGNTLARNTLARNTSARKYFGPKQLRPREYFGPLIYFGPEILRPDRLRPATLWPGDQTFKSVIFHHFWPSIILGGAHFFQLYLKFNDNFHEASFEVYYVSVIQKLVILSFSRIFLIMALFSPWCTP